jgi:DNA-directed RNA polymerase specialized sigma24 family protein
MLKHDRPLWLSDFQPTALQSDRELAWRISEGDPAALGCLYDRYACLLMTVAQHHSACSAEAMVESIFIETWTRGVSELLPLPLGAYLVELAIHYVKVNSRTPANRGGHDDDGFSFLAPFKRLDPFIRNVLILVRLGGLKVHEVAIALEVDSASVRSALASALRLLSVRPQADVGELETAGSDESRRNLPVQA